MRTVIVVCVVLLTAAAAGPAAQAIPRLGEPRAVASFGQVAHVGESASDAGHRALVVSEARPGGGVRRVVLWRRADGRWRRFALPSTPTPGQQVRLALLERGDLLVAWDDGDRIAVLHAHPDGRVGRPYVAFAGLAGAPASWAIGSDGVGTVVLVGTQAARAGRTTVAATVREPGGVFGAGQPLTTVPEGTPVLPPFVEHAGAITVRWRGGAARRPAAATPFGAAVADAWEVAPGYRATGPDAVVVAELAPGVLRALPRGTRSVQLAGTDATNGAVGIGPALRALCAMGGQGCTEVHRFIWPGGVERLALLVSEPAPAAGWQWFVARRGRGGAFVRPKLASANAAIAPLRGGPPGLVDFAGVDTDGAPGVPLPGARVFVMPFGEPSVLHDRRAPRVRLAATGTAVGTEIRIPVWCDESCALRIRARIDVPGRRPGPWRPAAALDRQDAYAVELEPFQAASLRVRARTRPGATLRLRITARDDAGRTRRARARFLATGPAAWARR